MTLFQHGAAVLLALAAFAVSAAPAPRVSRVTLYPGGATVEREIPLAGGMQRFELSCLPGSLDPATLRLETGPAVRVGDLVTDTLEGVKAEACRNSTLDQRVRELERQRAELDAQRSANELVVSYLEQASKPTGEQRNGPSIELRTAAAGGELLRQAGQDAYTRRLKLGWRIEEIERSLAPLRAERERAGGQVTRWFTVRFSAQSSQPSTVRLAYEVQRAGWAPVYRATLDSNAGTVLLERQAQIAQTTGEDWRGVQLKLSTGQPQRAIEGPAPRAWTVDVAQPRAAGLSKESALRADVAPAAAPAALPPRPRAEEPLFDASVFEGSYATEFELSGASDLASDGQRVTVTLSRSMLKARLVARVVPQLDKRAFVVAEVARPEGVWPRGTMLLRRDGAHVGSTAWQPEEAAEWSLPFGLDEQVQVQVEGERRFSASTGVFDSRQEQRMASAYVVRNGHRKPVHVQLLQSSPVSASDQIKAVTKFTPQPATERWQERAGVVAWEQDLAPNAVARFAAEYSVSYPKDAKVSGLR